MSSGAYIDNGALNQYMGFGMLNAVVLFQRHDAINWCQTYVWEYAVYSAWPRVHPLKICCIATFGKLDIIQICILPLFHLEGRAAHHRWCSVRPSLFVRGIMAVIERTPAIFLEGYLRCFWLRFFLNGRSTSSLEVLRKLQETDLKVNLHALETLLHGVLLGKVGINTTRSWHVVVDDEQRDNATIGAVTIQ